MMNACSLPSNPTVQDLIGDHYDTMGIPHFQRGLVWGDDNTSLLLESLYFDTPCGTIILWKPEEPGKHGITLSAPDKLQYLVIDGQQRIRSLRNALGPENGRSTQNTPNEEEGNGGLNGERVWCLNLSRVPELAEFFDVSTSRYPMFRLIADPTSEGVRRKHNFIPLHLFFEGRDDDAVVRKRIKPKDAATNPDTVVQKMKEIDLRGRIHGLRDKQVFFLKTLTESSDKNEHRLADVVALYNRINSAGKRVESEEKAFATLVSLHPPTNEWLRELFQSVHPETRAGNLERDDILKRRKERNFGFKLFIRTFIQVCAYRFNSSPSSNSFSFEVVNNPPFQERIRKNSAAIEELFKRTSEVLRFVREEILRNGLYCDDLQTLPDTTSLLPLFQVLIRFPTLMEPGIKERYVPFLQYLALRLLLSQSPPQEEIFKRVNNVNRAETARVCLEELRKIPLSDPQKDWLKDSNTLMDRYILMLYWLLRKRRARDFSYKNLCEEKQSRLRPGQEVALEEKVVPEKQHIVPYSLLEDLYDIEKRGRVSRHISNNIGNITFISHDLNSYETGLGSDPIKPSEEPPDNLACHFLGTDGEVKSAYETAIDAIKKTNDFKDEAAKKTAREAFEKFCEHRRRLIAKAFAEWAKELALELTILERVEPEARVDPLLQDRIRLLDYPDDIEDAILAMIADRRLKLRHWPKETSVGKLACRVSSPPDKGFIIRFFGDRLEIEPAEDSTLYKRFSELMASKGVRPAPGGKSGNWRLPVQGENSATANILIEFGRQVSDNSLAG